MKTETVVFGGGCFWCTQAAFEMILGVKKVLAGYAGGNTPSPTYKKVSKGETNYAEVVYVEFDPDVVTFGELLRIFFIIHDPTTLDRQGNDVGSQYRSIILYTSEKQKNQAKMMIENLEEADLFPNRIVTEIKRLDKFYLAEEEHQHYFEKHPEGVYCRSVIRPKLEKLDKLVTKKDERKDK